MSSRIIIRTLRFCTCQIKNLEHTLKLLNYEYTLNEKCIIVNNEHIIIGENDFYMQVDSRETKAIEMFNRINSKLAEIEQMVKAQELIRLSQEQENAEVEMEAYRVRRIKAEKEKITYEKERLELENKSYIEAKKQSIIAKARSMGYSVEEKMENGAVKLKLIKRVY